MVYRSVYKCNAEGALAVVRAYTDPKTYELLQAIKRAYRKEQDAWREMGQFLLDHPQYPAAVVAGWLNWDDEAGIDELRRFEGPFPHIDRAFGKLDSHSPDRAWDEAFEIQDQIEKLALEFNGEFLGT